MDNKSNKKILIDIPAELYDRFVQSQFRKESNTDAEAIRSCIKYAIENTPKGGDCQ